MPYPAEQKCHVRSPVIRTVFPATESTGRLVLAQFFYCLILIAVVQHRTVITGENDNRIFCQSQRVQRIQESTATCLQSGD